MIKKSHTSPGFTSEVQKLSAYAISLTDLFLLDCLGARKKKRLLPNNKKFLVNLFCTLTSLSGGCLPPGNKGFHSTNSALLFLEQKQGLGHAEVSCECAQVSRATSGSRTENSLRMQVLPQTAKTLLQSSAKARRYFKNKVLEIQKCCDIFSDSHPVYSQTRITDTTHGFFPSGATAVLCDLFLLM